MAYCYHSNLNSLIDHKAIIYSGGCCYCVLILDICPNYIKAIEVITGNIKIFNFCRIDYIEPIC